ncbi:helix-turn-helix domain-containing protein [Gluconacetobacter tumulisoli]|uniref:Helix-turn-helix transcriptional regulator n=1 Tax=Gluconacetobacter tumulisoli TaxID=1286189 RepID=A0A7W4K867_9PROT|nr:helix-turn-helix domain-containing protein [Gluconacetobacter tumulisoli]MBB2202153.1 helix-turn-helix transcriptional regulator [Gluconacetobacter tumulisoli]
MVNQSLTLHYSGHDTFEGRAELLTEKSSAGPSPVDVHVGSRIRLRRTLMGLSQERLGDALGLTFQQVQKYERGTNRVSASRLFELSGVLDVPVSFFFDGLDSPAGARTIGMPMPGFAQAQEAFGGAATSGLPASEMALFSRRETIELVRTYYRIDDQAVRRRVLDLIRTMAPQA